MALGPLFGPLPAGPLAFAPLLGPLAVPAGPLAFGPPAPGAEPRCPPGAEPCCAPGAAECEGGDCLGGLACCCGAAGLGAACFEFGFCPQANIGTAITIESKIDFRRTLSLITRNLITASRQSELLFVTSPTPTLQAPKRPATKPLPLGACERDFFRPTKPHLQSLAGIPTMSAPTRDDELIDSRRTQGKAGSALRLDAGYETSSSTLGKKGMTPVRYVT